MKKMHAEPATLWRGGDTSGWVGWSAVLRLMACGIALLPVLTHSQTYSRTETYEYDDKAAVWVVDQVRKVTCVTTTQPVGGGSEDPCSNTVVTEVEYDTKGSMLTYKSYGKLLQTLTYNADGTVATVKDGNDKTTTLGSWYRGVPRLITHPDNKQQEADVDDLGRITWVDDENDYRTCYEYDAMGRMSKVTYPSESALQTCNTTTWNPTNSSFAQITTAEYGIAAGHWRQIVTTGTGTKRVYFDGQWRPIIVREYDSADQASTERFQRFDYDHDGRSTFESYHGTVSGLTSGKRTSYDALGRVTQVAVDSELSGDDAVLETTTEYLGGFQTRITDARGKQTTNSYLSFDQPSEDMLIAVAHPGGAYTDITRDAYGKALSIVRRNASSSLAVTRSYAYNSYQELCRVIEPETGATLSGYDGAGNLKWSAAGLSSSQACETSGTSTAVAARRVDRSYDARNRITSVTFADGKGNQSWTYTADGKPDTVSVVNPNMTVDVLTTFSYNRRRLPTREAVKLWSTTFNLDWAYNANGHLASQTYPSGLNIGFAPNALGQPTQAGAYATGVSYYPNGAIKGFTYGNGVVHSMVQNARQLPSRSTDCTTTGSCSTANMRLDLSYTYDQSANVKTITDGIYGRQNRTMTYDDAGRLATVASSMFGNATYAYNTADDLTQITISGGSQARTHFQCYDSKRRLTSIRTSSCSGTIVRALTYDVQGNLASQAGQSYVFDHGNRLREATGKEWYAYDGQGHRVVSTSSGGAVAQFIYSSKGQLLYTNDARNNKRVDHVYLGTSLVAQRERPSATSTVTDKYQHTDWLGTPIAVTAADKSFISKHEYEPYGQLVNGTLLDGPGYTGHVQDAATGLTYMQQRYYDPYAGRFLSVDPVVTDTKTGSSFNRYAYGNNNPYRFKDPDGRSALDIGFFMVDAFNFGVAVYTGVGVPAAAADLAASTIGLASPVPGVGQAIKAVRAVDKAADAAGAYKKYTPGGRFSQATKADTAERAKQTCEYCGTKTVPAQKSERGVTPPKNEAQTDHNVPRAQGGTNSPDNAVHSCRDCNQKFSDTPKPHPRE